MKNISLVISLLAMTVVGQAWATPTVSRQTVFELPISTDSMEYYVSNQGQLILDVQRGKDGSSENLDNGLVQIYSSSTGKVVASTPFSLGSMRQSITLQDGTRLFVDRNGQIGKYDFLRNKLVVAKPAVPALGPYDGAYHLRISRNQNAAYVFSMYGSQIFEFDVQNLNYVRTIPLAISGSPISSIGDVHEIQFQGKRALAATVTTPIVDNQRDDNIAVMILDFADARTLQVITGAELGLKLGGNYNRWPEIAEQGDKAIFCSSASGCYLVDTKSKKKSIAFMSDGSNNGSAKFSPDGKWIFAYESRTLQVLDSATLRLVQSHKSRTGTLTDRPILLPKSGLYYVRCFEEVAFFNTKGALVVSLPASADKRAFLHDAGITEDREDGLNVMTVNSKYLVESISVKFR